MRRSLTILAVFAWLLATAGCGGGGSSSATAQATLIQTEYYAGTGSVSGTGPVLADTSGAAVQPTIRSGVWTFYFDAGAAGAVGPLREKARFIAGVHDDDRHDYVRYNRDGSTRDCFADGIGEKATDGTVRRSGPPVGGYIPR